MKRLGLSVAIAAALGLSACGGSSGGSDSGSSGTEVSGTASKGIIVNGLVSAYLFDENGVPETEAIDTAITDDKGDYTLTIPKAHKGKPLYIDISNNAGAATMKCDVADGCGTGVAFGGDYDLDNTFNMGAVLPESAGSVSVNLTPLTTAAAKKALESIDDADGFGAATIISNANSSVANTVNDILGTMLTSITDVEVVDLTDATEVALAIAAGNEDDVQVAALNAAIVSAVQGERDVTIEAAINDFTDDLSEGPLVFDAEDDTTIDVAELLTAAGDVIDDVIAYAAEELEIDLDELVGEGSIDDIIEDALEDAIENAGELVVDAPSDTAGSANLDKVKNFVEELRELGTSIDSSIVKNAEGAEQGSVEEILENFDLQIDAADMASSEDADVAMEALGEAVGSIVDVFDSNFEIGETGPVLSDDSQFETIPDSIVSEETGLTVMIAQTNGDLVFTVDETVAIEVGEESEEVQMSAAAVETVNADVNVSATISTLSVDEDETETDVGGVETSVGSFDASVNLNVTGTVTAETISLEVNKGLVTGTFSAEWDEEENTTTGDGHEELAFDLDGFELALDVTMAQIAGADEGDDITAENAMSFNGALGMTLSSADVTEEDTDESGLNHEEFSYDVGVVGFDLSGTFGNATESFDAKFTFEGDARDVSTLSEVFNEGDKTSSTGGETNSRFVEIDITLTFDAKLAGIADEVQFSFNIERSGFDDVESSLRLAYPGRVIEIEATGDNLDSDASSEGSLTLTNNDGVVMQLDASEEDDTTTATIMIDGDSAVYGELAEVNGLHIIRYSDGTFVSAF